jgi:hypothetical protein
MEEGKGEGEKGGEGEGLAKEVEELAGEGSGGLEKDVVEELAAEKGDEAREGDLEQGGGEGETRPDEEALLKDQVVKVGAQASAEGDADRPEVENEDEEGIEEEVDPDRDQGGIGRGFVVPVGKEERGVIDREGDGKEAQAIGPKAKGRL